jgi:NADP-dependent 3-hydroxy acid dehydrogenase YdfG
MEAEELTEALPERSRAKGAHVLLAGRTREKLEAVARDIAGEGGSVAVAVLDALDDKAVDEHADTVVSSRRHIRLDDGR